MSPASACCLRKLQAQADPFDLAGDLASLQRVPRPPSASPRSREPASATKAARCSSVAEIGDFPAISCTPNRRRYRISPPSVGQPAGFCLGDATQEFGLLE